MYLHTVSSKAVNEKSVVLKCDALLWNDPRICLCSVHIFDIVEQIMDEDVKRIGLLRIIL